MMAGHFGVPTKRASLSMVIEVVDGMARPPIWVGRDSSACRLVGRSLPHELINDRGVTAVNPEYCLGLNSAPLTGPRRCPLVGGPSAAACPPRAGGIVDGPAGFEAPGAPLRRRRGLRRRGPGRSAGVAGGLAAPGGGGRDGGPSPACRPDQPSPRRPRRGDTGARGHSTARRDPG